MISDAGRPRVGVSSCLLGASVRFNGGHKRDRFLTDSLGAYVDWVPYCPEVEIGLGTPREPIRVTADERLVNRSGSADHTAAMASLPLPSGVDGYVFKAKSPSCGLFGIPRFGFDGQASGVTGPGLYASRVMAAFPLLAVEDEGRLNDAGPREAFVERLFAAARLRALLSASWEPRDLVAFHARHELQLLAHDPLRYRAAGRVVAAAGRVVAAAGQVVAAGGAGGGCGGAGGGRGGAFSPAETGSAYRELFLAAMARPATRGRNADALQHAYSRIGRSPGLAGRSDPRSDLRSDLVARVDSYPRGEVPLSVPVALLARYACGGEWPWLAEQTYLSPFPAGLRHAVGSGGAEVG